MHFTILSKPCSVNALYMTRGRFRILSSDGRKYKDSAGAEILSQIQHAIDLDPAFLASLVALEGQELSLKMTYHTSTWLTQKGKIRKKDIASYEKATVDTLFEALSQYAKLDDSQVWHLELDKVKDTEDQIEIELKEVIICQEML